MSMNVRVIRLPGSVKSVVVNTGATVADALSQAGMSVNSGESLKVNGLDATSSTVLTEGAVVLISAGAKGNSAVVEHQTLVNGRNVVNMSKADLIDAAVKVKAEIAALEEANKGLDSKAISQQINTLKEDLKNVVKLLDAKK